MKANLSKAVTRRQITKTPKLGNWREERGQATVEFVLTSLFLLLLIFGIFELIMLIYTYNVLSDAAKEGVRYAVVHGSESGTPSGPNCPCPAIDGPPGTGVVENYSRFAFHDISSMIVTVTYPDTLNSPPNRVRVVVAYPFKPLLGFNWPKVTVNAAAEGRIVY